MGQYVQAVLYSAMTLRRKEVTHFLTTDAADAVWNVYLNKQLYNCLLN